MSLEQTDADFAAIERARDLPPDEPYGDREADYWDAEDNHEADCVHDEHVWSLVGSSVGRCIWCGTKKP